MGLLSVPSYPNIVNGRLTTARTEEVEGAINEDTT